MCGEGGVGFRNGLPERYASYLGMLEDDKKFR